MSIEIYIVPITQGVELVTQLLETEFGINNVDATDLANEQVAPHFGQLKDTCYLVAETNYVDKVYRDSYYHYYSSKLNKYKRDCIRLSIFEGLIKDGDFKNNRRIGFLQRQYRGFIVLRPTDPYIIGRSTISPKALQDNSFLSCSTTVKTTVNSLKFEVEGFPHSSQDTETITCAETTLWAIMEYFGTKYPEYKPVLPSKIIHTLERVSNERQVPSQGLNTQQMSFALKDFGFGTRIYSKEEHKNDFNRLLSCYIESGIPLILEVTDFPRGGDIGHAMLCIGHEKVTVEEIDLLNPADLKPHLKRVTDKQNISIYDWDDVRKKFVFIDDNHPAYQKAYLDMPTPHYPADWHRCNIEHFIAPLYPKIYLEAFEAKNYALEFLLNGPKPLLEPNTEVLIRFYLTSSRSYKDGLALNETMDSDIRDIILETPMSKFIWIGEISNKNLMKAQRADGLIILDATEANILHRPLIFAGYKGKVVNYDLNTGRLEEKVLPLPPFLTYQGNLKTL